MTKFWKGQGYNTDWEPIDGQGNVIGPKDWQANREWAEANDPAGAWNFSPEVKAAHPVKWDQTPQAQAQANNPKPTPIPTGLIAGNPTGAPTPLVPPWLQALNGSGTTGGGYTPTPTVGAGAPTRNKASQNVTVALPTGAEEPKPFQTADLPPGFHSAGTKSPEGPNGPPGFYSAGTNMPWSNGPGRQAPIPAEGYPQAQPTANVRGGKPAPQPHIQPVTPYQAAAQQALQSTGYTPFTGPQNQDTEAKAKQLVNSTLDNPGTLNPQVLAQMKAKQKEQALAIAQQMKSEGRAAVAGKGYAADSGVARALDGTIDMGVINSLIGSDRDLDVLAAGTNRADTLNALAAADAFMGNAGDRAAKVYGMDLEGKKFGEGIRQFDATLGENARQFDTNIFQDGRQFDETLKFDNYKFGKDWDLRSFASQLAAAEQAQREKLGNFGMNMELLNFGEGRRRFDGTLGFQYNSANQDANNQLLQYLMSAFG